MPTRRALLAAAAGTAAALRGGARRPALCIFSKHLARLHYSELGGIVRQLGFDGCDLTVRKGGHVEPAKAPADLVRAIESIRGEGVEVPMVTTDLTSAADPYASAVLGLAGQQYMKVPYFKPGYYRYSAAGSIERRLAEVRRDLAGLVSLARANGIVTGFHNHSGTYVGQSAWEIRQLIGDMDPRWTGYYFDPCHATVEGGLAGWQIALRLALPRLKMVAMKDFYWEKTGGRWRMRMCPMGEGMVEWPKVFAALAQAGFAGPMSLHVEYDPPDELSAIARDLAWIRQQVGAAWGT